MAKTALQIDAGSPETVSPLTAEDLDRLGGADQDRVIDAAILDAQTGTVAQRKFFERRRLAGLGTGIDEGGRLVTQDPLKS